MSSVYINSSSTDEVGVELGRYVMQFEAVCRGEVKIGSSKMEALPAEAAFTVDNKYFTAKVNIQTTVSTEYETEAYILALSVAETEAAASSSTSVIASVIKQAEEADHTVKLLVVLGTTELSSKAREHWISWTCEHGYELIEVCTKNADTLRETHDEREKDGLPRVLEALGSHMWGSAEKKPTPSIGAYSAAQPAPTAAELGLGVSAAPVSEVPQASTVFRQNNAAPIHTSTTNDNNPFMTAEMAALAEEVQDDPDTAVFTMLEQARALREASTNGQLNDDERREQAAKMAMRMAAMFDLGEDSDSDA
jgi:hypothetical protein